MKSILNRGGAISPINMSLYIVSNLQATSKDRTVFPYFIWQNVTKKKRGEEWGRVEHERKANS